MLNSINPNVSNFKLRSNEPQKQTNMSFKAKLSPEALDLVIKDARNVLPECEVAANLATLLERMKNIHAGKIIDIEKTDVTHNTIRIDFMDKYSPNNVIFSSGNQYNGACTYNAYSALNEFVRNLNKKLSHKSMSDLTFNLLAETKFCNETISDLSKYC